MIVILLCVFVVIGLIQVIRPQLLWRVNRPLQRPFVKDYDATEPTREGYAMMRVVGGVFLIVAVWMLVQQIS